MEGKLNDDILRKNNILQRGERLFVQRFSEIINPLTIDSYYVKFLNAHWALYELKKVAESVYHGDTKDDHINHVVEETRDLLLKDRVLENFNQPLRTILLQNISSVKDLKQNRSHMLRLSVQLNNSLDWFNENYLNYLLHYLEESIDNNNLTEVEILTNVLVSELVNRGISLDYLFWLKKEFVLSKYAALSFKQKWERFKQKILESKKEFRCYFRIMGNDTLDTLKKVGLNVMLGKDILDALNSTSNISEHIIAKSNYIEIIALANDYFTASQEAFQVIIEKLNLLRFYHFQVPSILEKAIVKLPDDDRVYVNEIMKEDKLFKPARGSNKLLRKAMSVLEKSDDTTKDKIINTIQIIHSDGEESRSMESKYIHLWVALESFVSTGFYRSNIRDIEEIVPPVICSQYIFRLLRNFISDCSRCGKEIINKNGETIDELQYPNRKNVGILLDMLKDDTEHEKLREYCMGNTLLEHRCETMIDYFSSKEKVLELRNLHFQHVKWHLHRLYRIRNSLVHLGKTDFNLELFVRHLNVYLNIIVTEVIHRIEEGSYNSMGAVFLALRDNYCATTAAFSSVGNTYETKDALDGVLFTN